MLERILEYIKGLEDTWIVFIAGLFSFLENLFPPLPSDVIVLAASGLLSRSGFNSIILFLICSVLSTLGFMTLYFIGVWLEDRFIGNRTLPFVKKKSLEKAHHWFEKLGFQLILINRFFPGIRSVIALFSGINRLHRIKVLWFSFISSMLWNGFLIYLGKGLGTNWNKITEYLSRQTYGLTITATIVFIILIVIKFKKDRDEI